MKKRISLTIILIAIACIAVLVMPARVSAATVIASGNCGADSDNVTWTLESDGLLTISGGGEMADYDSYDDTPWVDHLSEIQYVWVSNGITYIGRHAFYGCANLEEVNLPIGLTSIGSQAFANCNKLESVNLPDNLTSIGICAFNNCTSLSSITIPSSLTSIGSGVFSNSGLQSIVIPENITRIEAAAFAGSKQLSEVTLSEGLVSLGYSAFSSCPSLTTITIPASVTDMPYAAIYANEGLTAIHVAPGNTVFCDVDGVLFDKGMTRLIGCPAARTGTCVIPEGITTIGSEAFYCCKKLDAVTIPESVTNIESGAFYYCTISDIYYAGTESEWASVTVASSIENATMHYAAHSGECGAHATWTLYDDGLLVISGSGTMDDYGPSGSGAPWNEYKASIQTVKIESGITSIGKYAFARASCKSLIIENANLTINDNAFYYSGLTSIDFGTGIISPKSYVFDNCDALTSITIPSNVYMDAGSSSGHRMFAGCDALKNAVVECAYVGPYFFEGSGLESVSFTDPDVRFYYLENGSNGNPFSGYNNKTVKVKGYVCSSVPTMVKKASNSVPKTAISFEPFESDPGHRGIVEDPAVAATCETTGLTAGYHCSVCGQVIVAQEEIPALGHSWGTPTYVWAEDNSSVTATAVCTRDANHTVEEQVSTVSEISQEATCTEAGEKTYTATFTKEPFTTQTRSEEIAALHHDLKIHEPVAATCTEGGTDQYWSCERCDKLFSDGSGEQEIENIPVIPAIEHDLEHHELDPATCSHNGTLEHWQCSMCKKYFSDAEATSEVAESDLVIAAPGHSLEHEDAVAATCETDGHIAGWTCTRCYEHFSDEAGTQSITESEWIITALGHEWEVTYSWLDDYSRATAQKVCKHDADHNFSETVDTMTEGLVAPQCGSSGTVTYVATFETDPLFEEQRETVVLPALAHFLTKTDAVAPTCTTAGNHAYWYCDKCRTYFSDADGQNEIEEGRWVIPANGHKMVHHPAVESTCEADGNSEYWACSVCH